MIEWLILGSTIMCGPFTGVTSKADQNYYRVKLAEGECFRPVRVSSEPSTNKEDISMLVFPDKKSAFIFSPTQFCLTVAKSHRFGMIRPNPYGKYEVRFCDRCGLMQTRSIDNRKAGWKE